MTMSNTSEIQGPIFVGGMFKSGTSLLRALLGQHPNIASGLESYWFDIDWADHNSVNWQRRIQTLAQLYEFPEADVLALATASHNVSAFLTDFMSQVAAREGKARWAEKTPGNIIHAERLFELWPNARLIHIIRDPRDIYASLVEAQKWSSPEEFGSRWCAMIGAAENFKANHPSDPRFLEIRYEALTLNPVETMRDVIAFIGEPWDDAVAQFAGQADDYDRVLAVTGKASTTLERLKQPLSRDRVHLWPRVLNNEQLDAIHARARKAELEETMIAIENETDALLGQTEQNDA